MSIAQQTSSEPTVAVSPDRMKAVLRIAAATPPDTLDAAMILEILRKEKVAINDAVTARVEELVRRFRIVPQDLQEVVAEGTPVVQGKDGQLSWESGLDPQHHEVAADSKQAVNHYERSAFLSVKEGQHVATLVAPTTGEPGFDVCGQRINSKAGKPYQLKKDPTISLDSEGRVLTVRAGLLSFANQAIRVTPVLDISESVDFSTGNIRFFGSVVVGKGVCDRFKVESTEDVIVKGLIEAAHIRCERNFQAEGGMAGKEQGTIEVGADLIARYIDGVQGHVGGNARLQREMIDCHLQIDGTLEIAEGAIIGGDVTVGGTVRLDTLGSDHGVHTVLRLGFDPDLATDLHALSSDLARIDQLLHMRDADRHTLDNPGQTLAALKQRRSAVARKLTALRQHLRDDRLIELTVVKAIHAGVTLVTPRARLEFDDTLRGPMVVRRNPDGQIMAYNPEGHELPLSRCARTLAADAI